MDLNLGSIIEKPEVIESVKLDKLGKIDVLCIVNQRYAILIEDKTNTKNHSDQLARYYQNLQTKYSEELIHPIYFKTGDQACYKGVKGYGYSVFLRKDFLEVLNYGAELGIINDIFHSFRDYLQHIEDKVTSYLTTPYDKWGWYQWIGFYKELQKQLGEGHWEYVPQINGGFLGFWWEWQTRNLDGIQFRSYLQLEEKKFCFKIIPSGKKNAAKERDFYRGILFKKAKEQGIDIRKNGRVGASMTVAAFNGKHVVVDENKILNLEKTIEKLKKIEDLVGQL
ncbi:PD-(D/E)XK nuclease family protein [Pontibacter pamirensis]|uniref:PD-(D/E)XK nuclease family protein n=1 Tax=Pontibacter pamirensis TaxID=2562824 RepID=UPI00138954A4|nr:PD-(D/E)XK nuclease family protein [Pontibacter pamirensis]